MPTILSPLRYRAISFPNADREPRLRTAPIARGNDRVAFGIASAAIREPSDSELSALTELREKPAGTIRTTEHSAETSLWPALAKRSRFIPTSRWNLRSITASPISSRNGTTPAAKDMIAVRIGLDFLHGGGRRAVLFGTQDLTAHDCIIIRRARRWVSVSATHHHALDSMIE